MDNIFVGYYITTKVLKLACANKQRLIMAIDEWHHEEYSERKKSFPAALTSDSFKRSRRSDNSDDVSRIKFNACNT